MNEARANRERPEVSDTPERQNHTRATPSILG